MSDRPRMGEFVRGVVAARPPFGVFITLERWPSIVGLIRVTDNETNDTAAPEVGAHVEAHVIGFDERNGEVILSMRPSPSN